MTLRPDTAGTAHPAITPLYERWVSGRTVSSFGTIDKAPPIAFQKWHHFKEAFPPELIAHAVIHSGHQVSSCLDPFGGSGTTPLTCQMLGIDSTAVEVNPFLADVILAKLTLYSSDDLVDSLAAIRRTARRVKVDPIEFFHSVPPTFLEPGVNGRWIFNLDTASRLASLLTAIEGLSDDAEKRLFRSLTGGLLTEVSNVVVSGKGRRYRRLWQQTAVDGEKVDRLFARRAHEAILDIQQFGRRTSAVSNVVVGDSRIVDFGEGFDIAVFSPPYPNSFDYTDVYNLELWVLGYLHSSHSNRELRTSTLASHVQLAREFPPAPHGSATLDHALDQLETIRSELWSPWLPSMVGGYFHDLTIVLDKVHRALKPDGTTWMVVGDSRYSGIPVRVAQIISELSSTRQWKIDSIRPVRHMRSSVQQGWVPELAESLIVMKQR